MIVGRRNKTGSLMHIECVRVRDAGEAIAVVAWPASYADFIAANERRLLRFAYLVAGDKSDAEDAVQDAVLKVARHWSKVDADGAFAYLRTAVTNEILQSRRRRRETPTGLSPGESREAADPLLRLEEDQAFFARLQILAPKQRAAVVLRYYCDLPDNEIATHLNCSTATVRSQIHRALSQLRSPSTEEEVSDEA